MKNVLLIHGALGSMAQLEPLHLLLKSGHHVHSFDLSGHGADTHRGALSMERFGGDILRQMDALGWEYCVAFGYSMGGYAALQLAAQHPGRIAALVTLGSKWAWNPELASRETAKLNPAIILEKVPRYATALEQVHTGIGWKALMEHTAVLLTGLGVEGSFPAALAAQVDIPVRILLGDGDKMVSEEESRALAAHLPKGSFKLLPDTPHPLEKVDVKMLAANLLAVLR
jgi:pimeloyl-ACP methyl ester carboxylesterase